MASLKDEALGIYDNLTSKAGGILEPTVRLGVTGLSRSGKTVFITALVHNLLTSASLPVFRARDEGRIAKVTLQPQPDDDVPRFAYEEHLKDVVQDRNWPSSTRSISQLRLKIEFETNNRWDNILRPRHLNLDIVDYPGEWLLDLPLLSQDFKTFSENAIGLAKSNARQQLSKDWLNKLEDIAPDQPLEEPKIKEIADKFADYLKACKDEKWALSNLPPGRFLLPGDLEGSPAVTFFPLLHSEEKSLNKDSLYSTIERRYESYKLKVIQPFYQNHFARLDRQIILIDTLQALNAGHEAVADLERGLADILLSFNTGKNNFLQSLFTRRIDKIMIAATKADHLHHHSHDRLEKLIRRLVERAEDKIGQSGADIDVVALAAMRATKEANYKNDGEELPVIVGTPDKGQTLGSKKFDGQIEKAIFPGDLPENPESIFEALESHSDKALDETHNLNFVKFRPPSIDKKGKINKAKIPHIRLDRALEFLIGDKLA